MNKDLTEIVFLLDRSGSMHSLTQDTIGGFNSFVEEQKLEKGSAILTTVLFDNRYEVLHKCKNIHFVDSITNNEYYTRGMTALLDAVGTAINDTKQSIKNRSENLKPSKVIFVITTDGYENSSGEFTQEQDKSMIEEQTNKQDWQFLFLGDNIDAVKTAKDFGINEKYASNYTASGQATSVMFDTLSESVGNFRTQGFVDDNWKDNIE